MARPYAGPFREPDPDVLKGAFGWNFVSEPDPANPGRWLPLAWRIFYADHMLTVDYQTGMGVRDTVIHPVITCDCDEDTLPGAIWPMASDSDDRWPYVERCDNCQRFADDVDAAYALAAKVDGLVIWHTIYDERGRWQPAVHATRP